MSTQPTTQPANKVQPCTRCNGTGWTQWAAGINGNCPDCYGFGRLRIDADGTPHVVSAQEAQQCPA